MDIKRILVPVDFSDDSLRNVQFAADFTKPYRAEIVLLHVIEPIYYATPTDMYASSPNLVTLIEEQTKSAKKQLQALQEKLLKQRRKVRALIKTGSPADVIAETSKNLRVGMIILSTHGRTGLAHVLLGSVAERVVRLATCPVMTVRPKRKRK